MSSNIRSNFKNEIIRTQFPKKNVYNPVGTYIDYKINFWRKKDMTYILGAKCSDGVVLVGDTKVTIDDGADYTYSKKITQPLNAVVMGSAGIGGLYKDFQNRALAKIYEIIDEQKRLAWDQQKQLEEEERLQTKIFPSIHISQPIYATEEGFSVLVAKVLREMHTDYDSDRHLLMNQLMIICATRINGWEAQLTAFNPYGFPEPVNKYRAIGHGESYGALFLKNLWNPQLTMEETAKLGIFIIKFIADMKLDNSVGYDNEFMPQVFYIPHVIPPEGFDFQNEEHVKELNEYYSIREATNDEVLDFTNEVGSKITEFSRLFKTGAFKL